MGCTGRVECHIPSDESQLVHSWTNAERTYVKRPNVRGGPGFMRSEPAGAACEAVMNKDSLNFTESSNRYQSLLPRIRKLIGKSGRL